MMNTTLHDEITRVLNQNGNVLALTEIHRLLSLRFKNKNRRIPSRQQISARISSYPNIFKRNKGIVTLQKPVERRLFRITWNTTGWETPIEHKWKKENQGKRNVAYENQYGFGHEEWLFNPRFQFEGYQYGYIRGVKQMNETVEIIDEAYLFTINPQSRERYLVGVIKNLEKIGDNSPAQTKGKRIVRKHVDSMRKELKSVNASLKGLRKNGFIPCVRFKFAGNQIFDKLVSIPALKGRKYNRFEPYIIDETIEQLLGTNFSHDGFIFRPGVSKNKKSFEREVRSSAKSVERFHSTITDHIVHYLAPTFSEKKRNLSVEKTTFGENVADVVLKHTNKSLTIIEVKTSTNCRRNVREAVGQLLDYAFWYSDVHIKELIVVSPAVLELTELKLFKRLQKNLNIAVSYWQYKADQRFKSKFEKIV